MGPGSRGGIGSNPSDGQEGPLNFGAGRCETRSMSELSFSAHPQLAGRSREKDVLDALLDRAAGGAALAKTGTANRIELAGYALRSGLGSA